MTSGNIRKNLLHLGINFNEQAVVLLTKSRIPLYLKVVASFGKNFSFPPDAVTSQSSLIPMLICLSKLMNHCDDFQSWRYAEATLKRLKSVDLSDNPATDAQDYILRLLASSINFLRHNRSIMVVQSDKGGKSVIIDRDLYSSKVYDHLRDNIAVGNYVRMDETDQCDIRTTVETRFRDLVLQLNPYFKNQRNSFEKVLHPEPYLFPRMYGCIKIHKPAMPVRPVVASADIIGSTLSQWVLECLKLISLNIKGRDISDASAVVRDLCYFMTEPGHVMFSLDYVSMFTNVDVADTIGLVLNNYHLLQQFTDVPPYLFVSCLRFFTTETTFFLFDGVLYKQIKGLAMGNKIAQVMAEIKTNSSLCEVLPLFPPEDVSFFYKYVDDIFGAASLETIPALKAIIESSSGMDLTLTSENAEFSVQFLDCEFVRSTADGRVLHKWFKKECSSLSIINFHSYHPMHVKANAVCEMVRRARCLTSPEYEQDTEQLLNKVLVNSSYPQSFIIEKLYVTQSVPRDFLEKCTLRANDPNDTVVYVSCPYIPLFVKEAKRLISTCGLDVTLALRPMRKSRDILYSAVKDSRPVLLFKDSVFLLRCSVCDFSHLSTTGQFDVERRVRTLLLNQDSAPAKHLRDFPVHSFDEPAIVAVLHKHEDTCHAGCVLHHL